MNSEVAVQQDIDYIESLLGQQIMIEIKDSRKFVGRFVATDNKANVILKLSREYGNGELSFFC